MERNQLLASINAQPLVSISILVYNGEKYLKSCLDSVFKQSYSNLEIIVIDNASQDSSRDFLKTFPQKTNLKIIYNSGNVGFCAGHNQGIRKAEGEYILCLNQDIILDKDFIKNEIDLLVQDEKTGAVQGKLLRWKIEDKNNEKSDIIDTTGLVIFKNRRIINRGQGEADKGQFEKTGEIFGADGAAPIYSRKALEDVKINNEYFDKDFFAYKEDIDLAWRMRLYGWKTFYQPKAIAWHDRTSGESATKNYFGIIKERLKVNRFGKYQSFKNGRLMQIKNETIGLLLRHFPWFLPKEIASWIYILFFEQYTWKAIRDLARQAPGAWRKRRIIMEKKRISNREMAKWFK